VHFSSKFKRKLLSNQGKPQQAKPERDVARRSRAPPRARVPCPATSASGPRRSFPRRAFPRTWTLPHVARMPRCLVPRAARANRARPGGPSAASVWRAGRGQAAVRTGSRGRGRLTARPGLPLRSFPIRSSPPCSGLRPTPSATAAMELAAGVASSAIPSATQRTSEPPISCTAARRRPTATAGGPHRRYYQPRRPAPLAAGALPQPAIPCRLSTHKPNPKDP
jgi:hypothetical protein